MLFNTLLVIVLSVSGVLSQREWSVTYTPERICALKGSSVDLRCTYSYPPNYTVQKTFWFIIDWNKQQDGEDLSQDPEYSRRVEYLGDKYSDCTFRINQLRESDSETYLFTVLTDLDGGLSNGEPGVTLAVTDLQVMVNPGTVTEGQSVRLTCSTTCTLTGSPAFIWYRGGSPLSFTDQSHQFTASSEDRGRYTCAVKGYELRSPAVALNVRCLQVKVTENEAQSVTLTCSSTCTLSGSPTFTWNKNGIAVSHEYKYSLNLASTDDTDLYSCATGGDTSPAVNVKCVKVEIISDTVSGGETVELTCRATCTGLGNSFIWYKNEQLLTGDYRFSQSYGNLKFTARSEDTGKYYCAVRGNQHLVSPAVTLSVRCVKVEIKSSTVSEGVSVTLTCKITCTDLTGSQTFIWYKNGQYRSHTTQNYQNHDLHFKASSGHAGSYSCAVTGHENLPSPAVTLSVRCLKVDINSDTVSGGETVELTCTATCTHLTGSNSFIWYKNEQLLTGGNRFSQSHRILKFTARSGDTGRYSCAVRGNQHLVSPAVTLSVRCVKVEITSSTVSEGECVTLTCKITCTDLTGSQTFIWYKNGQYRSHTTQNYQNHDLQFKASSGDAGSYSCAVTGHENLLSPAVTLSVRCLKVDIHSDTVSGGETVELTCTATCTGLGNSFIWYKNEQLLPDDYRFSQSHRILTFTARSGDTGRYSCAVRGNQHLVSPAVTLSVRCVKVEIKPSTVNEGVSVTLTCKITCTDLTGSQTFIWNKNGQYLSHTTQTYQNHDLQFKASSGDAGSYSCAVTGHENLPSPAVTLSVRCLKVDIHSDTVSGGETVELTCTATCTGLGNSFIWYKNEQLLPDDYRFSQSHRIHTFTARSGDTGRYSCAVRGNQHLDSPAVTLSVRCVKVEIKPSTVNEGVSVTLTCKITCTDRTGSQTFIWNKNGQYLSHTTQTYQNHDLQFKASSGDAGSYSCAVRGHENLPSPAVTLSVRCLKVDINYDTVSGGETVELTCTATCTHLTESNSFIWYKNEQLLTDDNRIYQPYRILTFTARSGDTGRYSCAVRGNQHLVSPAVTLSVRCVKVEITSSTVSEGVSVTLTCKITCTDLTGSQTFIWYKNGQSLSYTTQNYQNHDLQFNASSGDAGSYSCAVTGHENLPSPAVTLSVRCLKVDKNSDTVSGGETVELTCRATCTHLTESNSLIWYKNEQLLTDYYRFYQSYIKFTARSEDTGRFSCAVRGNQHLVSPTVTLSVRCVKVEIKSSTVSEGVRVTLTCKITCTDLTGSQTFIWYKNGQYLSHTTQKYQNHDLQFTASSGDAGSYSCAVTGHENLPSPAVTLSVRCLKVDINSDTVSGGETVELTCTATCTYPTGSNSFIWYKNEQLLTGGNRIYQPYRILKFTARSGDTGRYSCAVNGNQHLVSPAVTLSVRCVKVEIKPSTVSEGVSVTLTCKITCTDLTGSQTFIWYKNGQFLQNTTQKYENHNYLQFKASSGDTGSYSCAVRGHENLPSPAVTLSVRYPPKNTSVAVSPSGEIVEGSSVTLTCSSDANPPVQNYTWFKKNDTGVWLAGSGQSLNFSNFRSWNRGRYYCEAQNRLGAQNASAILVTVQGGQSVIAGAAVGVAAILALVFLGVVCLRRRKSTNETEGGRQGNKSPIFGNVSGMAMSHTGTQGTDRDDSEVPLYASVQPANTRNQEELLPSTVQKPLPQCEEGVQYASIQFRPSSAAPRSKVQGAEDSCVIYSTVSNCNT
ncbi:basement membrane-specific heparan sulfate proteoglycan core protein-like [Anguilla anguilla]|uniref:basement membrane-specific heparan sulfate proteoglycan core protein-like n=1 Tax=Anguilla anguilla TaxID=7936 RepID=UPI0015AC2305|nr:basement membrane-specific heparan sulfate proteoglycan core protein-like [Anguilla anguilla]